MKVYLSRGARSKLVKLGARRALDAALLDPDLARFIGKMRVTANPPVSTGLDVLTRRIQIELLSTGVRGLDSLLGGGLEPGYVTELIGEFGAGKTQLCHQLAVMVQLPRERGGLSGKALYIDAEGTFRPERVISIARYRGIDPEKTLENIKYIEARSEDELLSAVLKAELPEVKLMIVDTLVAAVPLEEGSEGLTRRQYMLSRLMRYLRGTASRGRVVIIANRMSADQPAGGLALALGSHYRLFIRKLSGTRRQVELIRASHLPPGSVTVILAEEGVLDA